MATYKLPDLKIGQGSSSTIYLFGDPNVPDNKLNVIKAGWHISPAMYETSYPRFFTYWTDSNTGNWWVTYNDELPLGYFPKELLPKMNDYAKVVQMGGHVYSPLNVPSPPMGSGHSGHEGPNRAAYIHSSSVCGSVK
ncbi:hypothetical protein ZIOFF_038010 [Zingiber officinale]|uniref:Neprosin PEP catalytic domain-containing protein n=1 Tax=Zingiber officinale TaxID=94328 RepID=A0A8J5LAE2_ZINOF|nr:hypothetical protein ZIOFF_038010 [Zingiber officinale]